MFSQNSKDYKNKNNNNETAHTVPLVLSTEGIISNNNTNGPYITTSAVHRRYYPCSTYSNAASSKTQYMPYSWKVFGRTVNKKCLVSETGTVVRTGRTAVH